MNYYNVTVSEKLDNHILFCGRICVRWYKATQSNGDVYKMGKEIV